MHPLQQEVLGDHHLGIGSKIQHGGVVPHPQYGGGVLQGYGFREALNQPELAQSGQRGFLGSRFFYHGTNFALPLH